MTVYIGPSNWWWISSPEATDACHYKAFARCCAPSCATRDGSRLICKSNGGAWFVAPNCTQVSSQWAGGQYNTTLVGNKCCIFEWPTLNTLLLQCGFNPCDWFVPSSGQLNNPGFVCRTRWDTFTATNYWSSTETTATGAYLRYFASGACNPGCNKAGFSNVRAFRFLTY